MDEKTDPLDLFTTYRRRVSEMLNAVKFKRQHIDTAIAIQANCDAFFAAKAVYLVSELKAAESPENRQGLASLFNKWTATEYSYMKMSILGARRWMDLEETAAKTPTLLQYRTVGDGLVRPEHAALDGITLPMDDPFWDTAYPPLDWNCRCHVIARNADKVRATDSEEAQKKAATATSKRPHFSGNAGKTGIIFPQNISYNKRVDVKDRNALYKNVAIQGAKEENKVLAFHFKGEEKRIICGRIGKKETAFKHVGNSHYIVKNTIANNLQNLLPFMQYKGDEAVDLTHNTGKTLKLKKRMRTAHKFEVTIKGNRFTLTFLEYKNSGDWLFYHIK